MTTLTVEILKSYFAQANYCLEKAEPLPLVDAGVVLAEEIVKGSDEQPAGLIMFLAESVGQIEAAVRCAQQRTRLVDDIIAIGGGDDRPGFYVWKPIDAIRGYESSAFLGIGRELQVTSQDRIEGQNPSTLQLLVMEPNGVSIRREGIEFQLTEKTGIWYVPSRALVEAGRQFWYLGV